MIFSWLAAHLAVGGLFSLLFVPVDEFGRGFHRFTGSCASLLLAAGLAGGALRGPGGWGVMAASVGWVLITQWAPTAWFRPSLVPLTVLGAWALLRGTLYAPRAPVLEVGAAIPAANALSASILLGSVTVAMLLGHWYLVIPGLHIRHLRRLTSLLGFCLACRFVVAVGGIASAAPVPSLEGQTIWRIVAMREAFFFWQRVGVGLMAPAVLTLMVERTVRIRSTQSATGLLYVAVVLVLIGEMISRFLYVSVGIPQ